MVMSLYNVRILVLPPDCCGTLLNDWQQFCLHADNLIYCNVYGEMIICKCTQRTPLCTFHNYPLICGIQHVHVWPPQTVTFLRFAHQVFNQLQFLIVHTLIGQLVEVWWKVASSLAVHSHCWSNVSPSCLPVGDPLTVRAVTPTTAGTSKTVYCEERRSCW